MLFSSGKCQNFVTQFCHLLHWVRDEQHAEQNEHTGKQKTYEQGGASEYVHVNHDYICKIEIDKLWQTFGGLCAKTIPEYIPASFHTKCNPVIQINFILVHTEDSHTKFYKI